MAKLNLRKLFIDVFKPIKEDVVTVMIDLPSERAKDIIYWKQRREIMAKEWHDTFVELSKEIGFKVNPIIGFACWGMDGHDLPEDGVIIGGGKIVLKDFISTSTVIVAMTEFSVTAPLNEFAKKYEKLRFASMPQTLLEAQESALTADYAKVAEMCSKLAKVVAPADGAEVTFATGHKCYFDLKFRETHEENGLLPPNKTGDKLVNLPGGEVYKAPYEGEKNEPSKTHGELPVNYLGELVVYKVDKNKIIEVVGNGPKADKMRAYFAEDPSRMNIAEFGLGCNDRALVRESKDEYFIVAREVEEEKAGFHWAYGRSDQLGGIWGVDKFKTPETVTHRDIVYAKGSPIGVKSIELEYPDGTKRNIWDGEWYNV